MANRASLITSPFTDACVRGLSHQQRAAGYAGHLRFPEEVEAPAKKPNIVILNR